MKWPRCGDCFRTRGWVRLARCGLAIWMTGLVGCGSEPAQDSNPDVAQVEPLAESAGRDPQRPDSVADAAQPADALADNPEALQAREALDGYAAAHQQQDLVAWKRSDQILDQLGAAAVPALVQALTDDRLIVREQASARLALYVEHLEDHKPLLAALNDDSRWVRVNVASILSYGNEAADRVVPVLSSLLVVTDENIQQQAAVALGNYGADAVAATAPLTKLLEAPQADVRLAAANALGAIGKPARSALPRLQKLLIDSDPQLRSSVQSAIQLIEFEPER